MKLWRVQFRRPLTLLELTRTLASLHRRHGIFNEALRQPLIISSNPWLIFTIKIIDKYDKNLIMVKQTAYYIHTLNHENYSPAFRISFKSHWNIYTSFFFRFSILHYWARYFFLSYFITENFWFEYGIIYYLRFITSSKQCTQLNVYSMEIRKEKKERKISKFDFSMVWETTFPLLH